MLDFFISMLHFIQVSIDASSEMSSLILFITNVINSDWLWIAF